MSMQGLWQKATPIDGVPDKGYPYFAEPKLLGDRQRFRVDGGFAENAIMQKLRSCGLAGYVVEGMLRTTRVEHGDPILDVFDAWREDQIVVWHGKTQSRVVPIPYRLRRGYLELCLEDAAEEFGFVYLVEQRVVSNPTEAQDAHEANCVHGYAGTVYKQPGASYCFEQSAGWQVLRRPRKPIGYKSSLG